MCIRDSYIDDRHIISLQITAHMMRLSQLDEDLAHLRSQEFRSVEYLAAD